MYENPPNFYINNKEINPMNQYEPSIDKPNPQKQPIEFMIYCLARGEIDLTADQKLQHMWICFKITIGALMVRGFRVFKYFIKQHLILFWRRDLYHSQYLILSMLPNSQVTIDEELWKNIEGCVGDLEGLRQKALDEFVLLFLFALDYDFIQISVNSEIRQFLKKGSLDTKQKLCKQVPKQQLKVQSYIPTSQSSSSSNQTILTQQPIQHTKLREILHNYIDSFGLKTKIQHYKQLSKKANYLINTLNLFIFEETKPLKKTVTPAYSQIQSSNWSEFKKGRLQSDRKDIVLTGDAKILFVDITFVYKMQEYVNDYYKQEASHLLAECSKVYKEAKIKVVKIENSLTPRHVYSYCTKTLH